MFINRRRRGFTLVALLLALLLAGLVLSSGPYIGKARREKEIALTQRVGREALLFLMVVNQQSALHNRERNRILANNTGETDFSNEVANIKTLWKEETLSGFIKEDQGFFTFSEYGEDKDLATPPEITSDSTVHEEKIRTAGGVLVEGVPATISITLRIKTNFTMYGSAIRELRRNLLRSSYVTEVTFRAIDGEDDSSPYFIRELFISMLVGQKPESRLLFGFSGHGRK